MIGLIYSSGEIIMSVNCCFEVGVHYVNFVFNSFMLQLVFAIPSDITLLLHIIYYNYCLLF